MPGFEWIDEKERTAVARVMEHGFTMRYNFDHMRNDIWAARELEAAIGQDVNAPYVHVVSSGTAALHTALMAAGVGFGDEVIVPPFTFVASIEAIIAIGAVPVFADIDDTLGLNPEAVKAAITPKTRAINLVHMCGSMADVFAIKAIAEAHNLILLEDACQVTGAHIDGQYAGTIGDVGMFSFDSVKTVSAGEGGAILTRHKHIYEYAHQYSDHGHDHIGHDRGKEDHPILGHNFRISEMNAAMGLAQWQKLPDILTTQRKHKAVLQAAFGASATPRRVMDEAGDNAGFVNMIFADEPTARAFATHYNQAIGGAFYWYDNNWHYPRAWHHLRELKSPARLAIHELPHSSFEAGEASNDWMGRTVSILVMLNWTEADLDKRAAFIQKHT